MSEKGKLGGTCLNGGCIPAKELLETAATYLHVSEASQFGVSVGEPSLDWSVSLERKDKIVTGLVSGLASLLKSRKVTVLDGHGRLHAGRKVSVSGGQSGDVELTADAVVLAPGSLPRTIPGFERSEEHTSELQSLMRISYAVFCLKKKTTHIVRIMQQ